MKCPKLDSLMARRFKDPNLKGPDLTKAEASEKSLDVEQYKMLDVTRLLLILTRKNVRGIQRIDQGQGGGYRATLMKPYLS